MIARSRLVTGFSVAVGIVATVVVACNRVDPPTARIKIGVIAPFNTQPGEGIRNSVRMAVEEINKLGGVNGRQLEAVEVDDEYSSEKATQAYQRLAGRDEVVAVVGVASDGIFPIMEQLARYRVPMITTGTGADRLTDMVKENPKKYKWFFRVMHASSELGQVTADFALNCLANKHGLKRFAIMVEDDIWTSYVRDIWTKHINANPGTQVVFSEKFGAETKDFSVLFQQIAAAKADYILDASSRVDATTYLKRWATMNGAPIGAIPTGAGTKRYHDLLGDQGLFVSVVATLPSPENPLTPKSAQWWQSYYNAYGDPVYTSGYTYDAVHILAEAIRKAGTDTDALIKAIESTDYTGVSARWVFESNHQSKFGEGYREIPIMQYVEPGARGFKVIWPPSRAAQDWTAPKR
jgi:branched-chain amino acid transport system substrate-binding protein